MTTVITCNAFIPFLNPKICIMLGYTFSVHVGVTLKSFTTIVIANCRLNPGWGATILMDVFCDIA
jgi:hypothetical protein